MSKRTQIIITGLITFIAGFVLLKWYMLLGLGLMAGSWFVFDNLWLLEPHKEVNWNKVAKRVAAFAILGFLSDMLLRI